MEVRTPEAGSKIIFTFRIEGNSIVTHIYTEDGQGKFSMQKANQKPTVYIYIYLNHDYGESSS